MRNIVQTAESTCTARRGTKTKTKAKLAAATCTNAGANREREREKMRKVVNSEMVAHLWANQSQSEARNSSWSVSFDGPNYYSYRTVVACIVDGAALITSDTYSVTTSRHVARARYAARHLPRFRVPRVGAPLSLSDHEANARYLYNEFRRALLSWRRCRVAAEYKEEAVRSAVESLHGYLARFGVSTPPDYARETLESEISEVARAREAMIARSQTPAAIRKRERAAEYRERRKERERRAARAAALESLERTRADWDTRILATFGDYDTLAGFAARVESEAAATGAYRTAEWVVSRAIESQCRDREQQDYYARVTRPTFERAIREEFLDSANRESAAPGVEWGYVADYLSTVAGATDTARGALLALESRRTARRRADLVSKWRAGGGLSTLPYDAPTLLRRRDDIVQTSRGAEVPLRDARRLYALVNSCRARGVAWAPSGLRQVQIGGFTVSNIGADGTLTAGCHVIPWEEIARFATSQGWDGATEHASDSFVAETGAGNGGAPEVEPEQ